MSEQSDWRLYRYVVEHNKNDVESSGHGPGQSPSDVLPSVLNRAECLCQHCSSRWTLDGAGKQIKSINYKESSSSMRSVPPQLVHPLLLFTEPLGLGYLR